MAVWTTTWTTPATGWPTRGCRSGDRQAEQDDEDSVACGIARPPRDHCPSLFPGSKKLASKPDARSLATPGRRIRYAPAHGGSDSSQSGRESLGSPVGGMKRCRHVGELPAAREACTQSRVVLRQTHDQWSMGPHQRRSESLPRDSTPSSVAGTSCSVPRSERAM